MCMSDMDTCVCVSDMSTCARVQDVSFTCFLFQLTSTPEQASTNHRCWHHSASLCNNLACTVSNQHTHPLSKHTHKTHPRKFSHLRKFFHTKYNTSTHFLCNKQTCTHTPTHTFSLNTQKTHPRRDFLIHNTTHPNNLSLSSHTHTNANVTRDGTRCEHHFAPRDVYTTCPRVLGFEASVVNWNLREVVQKFEGD